MRGWKDFSLSVATLAGKSRHGKLVCIASAVFALIPAWSTEAKVRPPDRISVSGYFSQYTASSLKDTSIRHPASSADMELAVRLFSIVSLTGAVSNSIEPDPNDFETQQYRIRTLGGGLKFDLPGFFFIGSAPSDLRRATKFSPFNIFVLGEALAVETKDVVTYDSTFYVAGRFGLGLDIFPFTTYSHFTLRYLHLSFANNAYTIYSFGGGITF